MDLIDRLSTGLGRTAAWLYFITGVMIGTVATIIDRVSMNMPRTT